MTPKEAAEIINTIRRYHAHCGGCYVKGDQEALEIAENVLRGMAALEEATTNEQKQDH